MTLKRVRIEIIKAGQGEEAHEYDHCPISIGRSGFDCPLGAGECRYGLTEVEPPVGCPIEKGLLMKFKLIDKPKEDEE